MMRTLLINIYRFIFAHRWAEKINIFLFDCSIRGLGVLNYESHKISGELYLRTDILPQHVGATPTFFDVGANTGRYCVSLAARFPNATIHSFEPNPHSFASLKKLESAKIRPVNRGLSDEPGELNLFDRADDTGSEHASLYGEVLSEMHHAESRIVPVKVTTLDIYSAEQQVTRIDFLKIDTEGHDLKVVLGASRLIAENRIGVIQIEFNEMHRVSHVFYHDLVIRFPNHNFYRLLPSGLLQLRAEPIYQELFAFQNLIGIPKTKAV